jgi:hypothetical protein
VKKAYIRHELHEGMNEKLYRNSSSPNYTVASTNAKKEWSMAGFELGPSWRQYYKHLKPSTVEQSGHTV